MYQMRHKEVLKIYNRVTVYVPKFIDMHELLHKEAQLKEIEAKQCIRKQKVEIQF